MKLNSSCKMNFQYIKSSSSSKNNATYPHAGMLADVLPLPSPFGPTPDLNGSSASGGKPNGHYTDIEIEIREDSQTLSDMYQ